MVGASVTLSIITIVISFLLGVLGTFPLSGGGSDGNSQQVDNPPAVTEDSSEFDATGIEEVSGQFLTCYTDIIDDIASFQENPSLERAEARKEQFTQFAQEMIGKYQGFSGEMQGKLDELTSQANQGTSNAEGNTE